MLLVGILGIAVAAPPTECVRENEDDMDAICKTRLCQVHQLHAFEMMNSHASIPSPPVLRALSPGGGEGGRGGWGGGGTASGPGGARCRGGGGGREVEWGRA